MKNVDDSVGSGVWGSGMTPNTAHREKCTAFALWVLGLDVMGKWATNNKPEKERGNGRERDGLMALGCWQLAVVVGGREITYWASVWFINH